MRLWPIGAVSLLGLVSTVGSCGARSDIDPQQAEGGASSTTTSSSNGGSPTTSSSSAGPCPSGCDDAIACTTDTCSTDGCVHLPHDDLCDDGIPCTADACGPSGCVHAPNDALCDDGKLCTADTCDPGLGCKHTVSDAPCADGVACTLDTCDYATDSCLHVPCDSQCDDGVFCNGVERCDAALGCVSGVPACQLGLGCSADACSESSDQCTHTQSSGCAPATRILVVDGIGTLSSISPFGGPTITIATAPSITGWFDIAILGGRWFGLRESGFLDELWPFTTQIKKSVPTVPVNSLGAGPDGFLYGAGQSIFRIDPNTGQYSAIGALPPGYQSSGDVAFLGGRMFVSTDSPCGGALVEFDPASGTSMVVGGDGLGCVYGLAVQGQTLFVLNCDGKVGTFDPTSGIMQVLSTTGADVFGADILP